MKKRPLTLAALALGITACGFQPGLKCQGASIAGLGLQGHSNSLAGFLGLAL